MERADYADHRYLLWNGQAYHWTWAWATQTYLFCSFSPNTFCLILPPAKSDTHIKVVYWLEIMFVPAYTAVYLTILALYVKLFPHTWLRKAAYAAGIFTTLNMTGNLFILIFQCTPIRFFWDKTAPGGHCINGRACYFITSIILIITVIIALLLPMPLLWELKVSSGKRWKLLAAFSLGLFVVITSIYRLIAILKIDNKDPTFTFLGAGNWSALEIAAGVVSTCLSSMTPLIHWVIARFKPSSMSRSTTALHSRYDTYGKPISHGTLRSGQFNRIPPEKKSSAGDDMMVEMSGNTSRDRIEGEEADDRRRLVEDHHHSDNKKLPGDKVRVTTSVSVSTRPLGKDQQVEALPAAATVVGGKAI